jgi:alpha-N-acetylglucosaminidase
MGCLDGYGGPLPKTWLARHEELGKRILARQRELGMTPVLQGFTGHVPAALGALFPDTKLQEIKWFEWNTKLIDPLDPLFAASRRSSSKSRRGALGPTTSMPPIPSSK